jgi:hypothetical protein
MKMPSFVLTALGLTGLLFVAAESSTQNGQPPYGHEFGIRPHPAQNSDVPRAGYLVVTMPGGEYLIDRRDVISLSAQNYQIQGGMRVWEVTVSERSSHSARFYYTRPLKTAKVHAGDPPDEGEGGKLDKYKDEGASPVPDNPAERESQLTVPVRKEYPATTHAHTIEFRVESLEKLEEIYSYFCLMVYGWSPVQERRKEDRGLRTHVVKEAWKDWKRTQAD